MKYTIYNVCSAGAQSEGWKRNDEDDEDDDANKNRLVILSINFCELCRCPFVNRKKSQPPKTKSKEANKALVGTDCSVFIAKKFASSEDNKLLAAPVYDRLMF